MIVKEGNHAVLLSLFPVLTGGVLACSGDEALPPPVPHVAAVQVQPESAWVPVRGSWPFTAVLLDSSGQPLSGPSVAWTSSDTVIATVSGVGVADGRDTGSTQIAAAASGHGNSAVLTVLPTPKAGLWPNEPQGLTDIADDDFDSLSGSGWHLLDNTQNLVSVIQDSTAPFSPPAVLQYRYPVGFPGGIGPGAASRDLPNVTSLYAGIWWKASNPWQGHPASVNKIEILFPAEGGDIYLVMYGRPGGPYELRVIPQFKSRPTNWLTPNVDSVPVALGVWHRVEWFVSYDTTAAPITGIVRWWLDGELVGDYANVLFPSSPLVTYKTSAVWGGVGAVKTENDFYWYDQVHLSGR